MRRDTVDPRELELALDELANEDESVRLAGTKRLHRLVNQSASRLSGIPGPENLAQDRLLHAAVIDVINRDEISAAVLCALDDPSVDVRMQAAIMANNLTTPDAEATLIRHLLTDPVSGARALCAMALLDKSSQPVRDAFLVALKDQRSTVVSTACTGLKRIGSDAAIEPLRWVLNHPGWFVRFNACEALFALGAVDRQVITSLERLADEPEAANYDHMVTDSTGFEREYYGEEFVQQPKVREVLEAARNVVVEEQADA
jgi:HEAT repeat protein